MGCQNRDVSWHGVEDGSPVDEVSSSQAMGQVHSPPMGKFSQRFVCPLPSTHLVTPPTPTAEPRTLQRFHALVTVCFELYLVVKNLSSLLV